MTIQPLPEVTTPAAVRAKAWEHAARAHAHALMADHVWAEETPEADAAAESLSRQARMHAEVARALLAWTSS